MRSFRCWSFSLLLVPGVLGPRSVQGRGAQAGPAVGGLAGDRRGRSQPRAIASSTTRASRSPRSGFARRSRRRRKPAGPKGVDPVPVPGGGRAARRDPVRRRGARLSRPGDPQGGVHHPVRAPAGQRRPSRRQPVPRLLAAPARRPRTSRWRTLPRKQLETQSAEAAGTSHPAVLFMLAAPAVRRPGAPSMVHDEEKNTWRLVVPLSLSVKGESMPMSFPVSIILVGASEAA